MGKPDAVAYALHKGMGAWQLTFAGANAVLKQEQGVLYAAHLLYSPHQTIHGLELAAGVARCSRNDAADVRVDTGVTVVERHARVQERSSALDTAETLRCLR